MNEKCKYCDYVSKCSRICEYNSIMCKLQRSFPKVVDKSYEQLQQENKKLNGAVQTYDILLKSNTEENKQLKEDIKNIIKILEKNCDDLEATEEEFDSLDRWQELQVVELEQGSNSNDSNR